MGQPSITVYVDYKGTPHTFFKLDDGNGHFEYYGFAPVAAGSPAGTGHVGRGITTHAQGDPTNSAAGFIDDASWKKEISVTTEQYNAMERAITSWESAHRTYNVISLNGDNCTDFTKYVLNEGNASYAGITKGANPMSLIPNDEQGPLFIMDADGRKSLSDMVRNPLNTPGTPAYEYKQAHPELFESQSLFQGTWDRTTVALHVNPDGSSVEKIAQVGGIWRDTMEIQYAASGDVVLVTEKDGALNDNDYSTRTTTYDIQGRIDLIDVRRDDGTRDSTDYDQSNMQSWSRIDSHFDAQGRLDYSIEAVDDGSTTKADYDQTNVRGDSIWQTHTDAQGRTDWIHVTQDDGSVDWTDYDQANVRADRVSQTHFDAQGRTDWHYVTQDDGSHDWTDYDQLNARGDSIWQNHVDAQGREDWRYVTQDDGSRDWDDYDQSNVPGAGIWQNRVDAQGGEDWRYVTMDDGSHEWTDYDQAHVRGDSIWQNRTDALGRQDWVNITLDNGSRDWYDYDQDGSQGWRAVVSHFDPQGREAHANVYLDDGSRDWYDYDQTGTQSWSMLMSHFDAWGREDYASMSMDDGSRNVFDYDQDGSRSWTRVETRFHAGGGQDHVTRYFDDGSRFFVDFDHYGPGLHQMLGYNAFGQCIFLAEQVHGAVSPVFGSWNPAYGEGLAVQAVLPGGGGAPPFNSPLPPSLPHYDPSPGWALEVEVRVPYES